MSAADIIAQAVDILNCSPNEALSMPASRFFRLLSAGEEYREKQLGKFLFHLSDIGFYPRAKQEFITKSREGFIKMTMPKRLRKSKVLDAADPRTGRQLAALFSAAGKLRR